MTNRKPILYLSPLSPAHDTGAGHPECAARIETLQELFTTKPFADWPQKFSQPAGLDQILYAHDEDYVFDLQDKTPDHGVIYLDGDTILSPATYDAALHGVGAALMAVDDICGDITHDNSSVSPSPSRLRAWQQSKTTKAFCATRPPGHHAEPDTAMGFCFFNNIFIAARHAQLAHGVKKIAIVDFDVHHGNGTQTMTLAHNAKNPDTPIFYLSTHGHPLFPMSGMPADNTDTLLNVHLPDACASKDFRHAYETQIFPALEAFAPELLLLSSGFDAHHLDPLAPLNLQTEDYGWLTRKLCDIADKSAPTGTNGRVISILEGGYHLTALRDSVAVHLHELSA